MSSAGVLLATPTLAIVEPKGLLLVAVIVIAALVVCWFVMQIVLREAAKVSNALGPPVRDETLHVAPSEPLPAVDATDPHRAHPHSSSDDPFDAQHFGHVPHAPADAISHHGFGDGAHGPSAFDGGASGAHSGHSGAH